ncbi:hypothetical protein N7495_000684 [Penicillium taxi]|uniref:uncharacterized protein n=1 Tax=Penicillium taxi TaxID=168475 RepID=UPI002544F750|nr:uncharacterized protein N7495_000684 [Penicillium taxi]KAJ5908002.1 hypothetical protein N7495_000684 [Penicillium taxi]
MEMINGGTPSWTSSKVDLQQFVTDDSKAAITIQVKDITTLHIYPCESEIDPELSEIQVYPVLGDCASVLRKVDLTLKLSARKKSNVQ